MREVIGDALRVFFRHSDIKEEKLVGGNPLFSSPGLFLDSAVPGTAA